MLITVVATVSDEPFYNCFITKAVEAYLPCWKSR